MKRNLTFGVVGFFLVLTLAFVSADIGGTSDCGMMGGMMYGAYGGTGMIFSWLFGILVLFALVLLIIWLIKQIQPPSRRK